MILIIYSYLDPRWFEDKDKAPLRPDLHLRFSRQVVQLEAWSR